MALYVVLVKDSLGQDPNQVVEVIGPFGTDANARFYIRNNLDPDCRGEVEPLEFPR